MTTYKGILLDPFACKPSIIEYSSKDALADWKKLMAIPNGMIDIVAAASGSQRADKLSLDLVVDDEGLYVPDQRFFCATSMDGLLVCPPIYAGRAILVCTDMRTGETMDFPESSLVIMQDVISKGYLIRWLGDSNSVEKMINQGLLPRPQTSVNGEVVWQWTPADAAPADAVRH